jgi:hypothetical protein
VKSLRILQETSLFFECVVFENEGSFIKTFCWNPQDVMDLLSVYFNSSRIKFYYIITGGETVTSEVQIEDFLAWVKTVATNYD